ncbi:hypothetical protein NZK35_19335 [Stieleria sp. ICT_E10.1]|uniref:hypothetical protein n=1 Tax=Stieleria sedimenti TaxID=2976331 RepID=UPI0021802605|nr:hypothetical protein [Stieleria sedimenti]MCS7468811.1 hypothetical protein [Stieleria sedimenti]
MVKPFYISIHYFLLVFTLAPLPPIRGFAEEVDPQQAIWDQTQSLLQRREYSLAIQLLEDGLDDSELFRYTSRLQQDLDAVKRLQKLSESVDYAVRRLPKSTPLTVLSTDYRFDRPESEPAGTSLVLTNARGAEVTYPLSRLDSATWLQIVKPELESWPDKQFVTGIFLAFDRYPDTRVARAELNAAAETGQDITVWIKRLEDAEQVRKQNSRPGGIEPSAKDLLLGKWTVAVKGGPRLVWEFRRGGDGIALMKGRRQRATWEQESTGTFRFTGQRGQTAVINVAGDRIFGKFTNGVPFRGVRQAE